MDLCLSIGSNSGSYWASSEVGRGFQGELTPALHYKIRPQAKVCRLERPKPFEGEAGR
jgi:hypothetical protein